MNEVTLIQALVHKIQYHLERSEENPFSCGIISLYAAQCWVLNKQIQLPSIQISTVDAFQGNEKDLIILSTVRSKSIGFTADPRRLNVAITRAKSQLIIIGNKRLLETNHLWCTILKTIAVNGKIIDSSELTSLYLSICFTEFESHLRIYEDLKREQSP